MSRWKKIRTNLWRNTTSGQYYARMDFQKPTRHAVWRTLSTDNPSVAVRRLPLKLAEIRAAGGRISSGTLTLEECAAIVATRLYTRKGAPLAQRSLDYRTECVDALRKHLPGFATKPAAKFTTADLETWATIARAKYAGTRFNGQLQVLRAIFRIAIQNQACAADPTLDPDRPLQRAPVPLKIRQTPDRDRFGLILTQLDARRDRRFAARSIRAYAFTGLRPDSAKNLKPEDIDCQRETITAHKTKNGKLLIIPMIPQAKQLFEEDLPGTLAALKKNPSKALATVCRELGIPHLTPYDMRAMFTMRMLDAGVNIPTGASMLGHQDRGRTLLARYVHTDNTSKLVRKQMGKVVV